MFELGIGKLKIDTNCRTCCIDLESYRYHEIQFGYIGFFGSHLGQSTRHTWGTLNFYMRHCGGCYISEVFDTSCFHHSRLGFNMSILSIHRMSRFQYVLYHTRPVCTTEIL